MSARERGEAPRGGFPSREEVLAFLAERGGQADKRDIARHFDVKGGARIALKALLKGIEAEGLVEKRRGRFHHPGDLPSVIAAEITGRDTDGELLAQPIEWDEARGAPPRIVIVMPARPRPGEPVPGVGDRALLRIVTEPDGTEPATARVMKLIGRRQKQIIGVFRALPDGSGRVVPSEKKSDGREIAVARGADMGAKDGDVVAVSVERALRFGPPQARVRERFGSLKSERAVSLLAIHAHGIPHVFSEAVLAEAAKARPATKAGREDWRDIRLVTIDPADAKDHDDAVHARADDDPKNPGGFVVTIAIADVAAYVRPGSAMDREALERGNSVYFPDRVVPMLPERISNDLCSLRPLEDRPALAVRVVLAADGRKLSHTFHRILMRSAAKLAYEQAQAAIDGRPDEVTRPLLEPVLRPLWAAYACSKQVRDARGPLDLDLPERKLVLDAKGQVERVIVPARLDAHKLIEEFMILANVAAAETLERARLPFIYRVHDEPSVEKINALGEVLKSIGLKFSKGERMRPSLFNGLLAQVAGGPHAAIVNETVLRSQAQAEYAAENYGHFGLALRRYAHFTSPIRRYADLVVHRALVTANRFGKDGLPPETTPAELAEVSARISAAERRAVAAERETTDRLIAHFLADRIGAEFDGRIGGVVGAGLFVRLTETGADGFVPVRTLGEEFFRYEEAARALVGSRSGATWRLGDQVRVRLMEALPVSGALRFEIVSDPRRDGLLPGGAGRSKRDKRADAEKWTQRRGGRPGRR